MKRQHFMTMLRLASGTLALIIAYRAGVMSGNLVLARSSKELAIKSVQLRSGKSLRNETRLELYSALGDALFEQSFVERRHAPHHPDQQRMEEDFLLDRRMLDVRSRLPPLPRDRVEALRDRAWKGVRRPSD